MRSQFLIGICISLLVFVTHAAEPKTPVGKFVSDANFALVICRIKAETNAMKGMVDYSCSHEQEEAIKPSYHAAAKSLAKNKVALGMLRDLYAYWITTITTVTPSIDELKIQYGARMKERETGVKERIDRLLLEIGEL